MKRATSSAQSALASPMRMAAKLFLSAVLTVGLLVPTAGLAASEAFADEEGSPDAAMPQDASAIADTEEDTVVEESETTTVESFETIKRAEGYVDAADDPVAEEMIEPQADEPEAEPEALAERAAVYQIGTAQQLADFATAVNSGETDASAQLTANIVWTGDWTPIGSSTSKFAGTFDGNGKTVSGITNSAWGANSTYNGFFGCTDGATVKNLTIASGSFNGLSTAALIADAADTTIYNCGVGSDVLVQRSTMFDSKKTATLVGNASGSTTIVNCWTAANRGKFCYALVGTAVSTVAIKNCAVFSNLTVDDTASNYLISASGPTFENCFYTTGTVTGAAPGASTITGLTSMTETNMMSTNSFMGCMGKLNSWITSNDSAGIYAEWNLEVGSAMPTLYGFAGVEASYNITYALAGDGVTNDNPAKYKKSQLPLALKDPSAREGFVFGGWYSDSQCTARITAIPLGTSGDMTIYGKWTPDPSNTSAHPPIAANGAYQLSSKADLTWFATEVNGGSCNISAVLTTDIAANGTLTMFALTAAKGFSGTFDGAGHTISGITGFTGSTTGCALIGSLVNGGTVKDLTLSGSITTSYIAAGFVTSAYHGTIRNCTNEIDFTVTGTANRAFGGIVATAGGSAGSPVSIVDCVNKGKIDTSARAYYAGGILGNVIYKGITITGCANEGNVTGAYAGGIVGLVGSSSDARISDCYNVGDIKAVNPANNLYLGPLGAGGIVGGMDNAQAASPASISNVHSYGTVTNAATITSVTPYGGFAGGVIGILGGSASAAKVSFSKTYWNSDGIEVGYGLYNNNANVVVSGAPAGKAPEDFLTLVADGLLSSPFCDNADLGYPTLDGSTTTVEPVAPTASEAPYAAVYDYAYYRATYADLVKAFGDDREAYLRHFLNYGMGEGRRGNESFDVAAYYNRYPDLRAAFGFTLKSYYTHYLNYGRGEGRVASGADTLLSPVTKMSGTDYAPVYDYAYYTAHNPDVVKAFSKNVGGKLFVNDTAVLSHFVSWGMNEGRQGSAAFEVSSYYNRYPDLRAAFGTNLKSYYTHYLNYGRGEGRLVTGASELQGHVSKLNGKDYSAVYDGAYYAANQPDVRVAFTKRIGGLSLLDDTAILRHFVDYGMKEGRRASAAFDVHAYRGNYRDLQQAFGSDLRAYYLHYLGYGKNEGRITV